MIIKPRVTVDLNEDGFAFSVGHDNPKIIRIERDDDSFTAMEKVLEALDIPYEDISAEE